MGITEHRDAYFPVCHYWTIYKSYLLHMISKPSQKSRTFTSEIIAQFLQFTKSTSWSPNSWLKASGFQSSDFSFLCTPETSTGCGKKNIPLRKYFELRAKEWNRRVSWGLTFLVHDDLLFLPSFRIYGFQLVTYSKWKLLLLHYTSLSPLECTMEITSVALVSITILRWEDKSWQMQLLEYFPTVRMKKKKIQTIS